MVENHRQLSRPWPSAWHLRGGKHGMRFVGFKSNREGASFRNSSGVMIIGNGATGFASRTRILM